MICMYWSRTRAEECESAIEIVFVDVREHWLVLCTHLLVRTQDHNQEPICKFVQQISSHHTRQRYRYSPGVGERDTI